MKTSQKKYSITVVFEFLSNGINFTYRSNKGSSTDFHHYESITNEKMISESRNTYFYNTSISMMIIGLILFVYKIYSGVNVFSHLFLIASIILYFLYYITTVKFTILKTDDSRNLILLNVKNYEEVLQHIFSMRNNYLKEKYYNIDIENEYEDEVAKLNWLKNMQVISEGELYHLKTQLENLRDENSKQTIQ